MGFEPNSEGWETRGQVPSAAVNEARPTSSPQEPVQSGMPRECAFCPATANFSGEHIWSKWMRKLFKSKKFRFHQRNSSGKIVKEWSLPGIDLKAKVVCKPCNEGWMSRLEAQHAEPAMADLLIGA